MGVSDKGYMQNVQCWGSSRNVVENHWSKAHGAGALKAFPNPHNDGKNSLRSLRVV